MFRFLRAGAGENHLLLKRKFLVRPELLVHLPDALVIDDSYLALSFRRKLRDVMLGVNVQPAHEDAVHGLE